MTLAKTLTPEVREFLTSELRWPVLATINPDGSIQQSVMWFDLDGDTILMNTKRGRLKDRNLINDNRVSLCFEDSYRYVTIEGTVTLIDDPAQGQAGIHRLAVKYHGQEEADRQVAEIYGSQERVAIVLTVTSVKTHNF